MNFTFRLEYLILLLLSLTAHADCRRDWCVGDRVYVTGVSGTPSGEITEIYRNRMEVRLDDGSTDTFRIRNLARRSGCIQDTLCVGQRVGSDRLSRPYEILGIYWNGDLLVKDADGNILTDMSPSDLQPRSSRRSGRNSRPAPPRNPSMNRPEIDPFPSEVPPSGVYACRVGDGATFFEGFGDTRAAAADAARSKCTAASGNCKTVACLKRVSVWIVE